MMNPLKSTLLALAFSVLAPATLQAAAPESFTVSEYSFKRPATWEWVEVASSMRKAQLKVSDPKITDSAEVVFFHFGPSDGGGVQANVERWYGQFKEPKASINAKIEKVTVGGTEVTYVSAEGTYLSGMPGAARAEKAGYALRGAIVAGKQGSVFVKMTGPAALVKSADKDFKMLVESPLKK